MSIFVHQPRVMGDNAFNATDDGRNGIMQERNIHN
jgi:hypothetical protein